MKEFRGIVKGNIPLSEDNLVWDETRDIAIAFDGEIYNAAELTSTLNSKGYVVPENNFEKLVLFGIKIFGIDFLSKIEGPFAFYAYYPNLKKSVLARDKFGTRPLYYFANNECLAFGKRLSDITKTGLVIKEIDREALSYYFQLTYIPAPYSICKNVRKVMPGTYIEFGANGEITEKAYWKLEPLPKEEFSDYDYCKKVLRERLFRSVEKRMLKGTPMGAFLSGGFDSSIVVGVMSQISGEPINTFTVGFENKAYDETELAALVAKKNGTKHNVLNLNWKEAEQDINELLDDIDEPYADSSLIAAYAVSKLTKQHVDLALTGDVGDELFAGYNKYLIGYYTEKYNKIPAFIRNGLIKPGTKLLPRQSSLYRRANKVIQNAGKDIYEQRIGTMSLGFKYNEAEKLFTDGCVSKMDFIKPIYEMYPQIDEQTRAQFLDMNVVLEGDMLPKIDRAGRLSDFSTRAPILDESIVELAFGMPSKYKISGKNRKIIFKDTFSDLIPEELFYAKKKGFSVPIGSWIENNLKENILKFSDRKYLDEQGLFSCEYINGIIENHFSHKENRFSELWAFYVFQNWYEKEWKN